MEKIVPELWTKKDAAFKKIQEDIVKQYEAYAARDGIDFDPKTLS